MDANDFIKMFGSKRKTPPFRLGKIDPAYTSGQPKVVFDGETTASGKQYTRLSSYTPVASDRVVMVFVGGTYVITGKII